MTSGRRGSGGRIDDGWRQSDVARCGIVTDATWPTTPETRESKWSELSDIVEALAGRVADPHDFPVQQGSPLAGDDRAAHPFEVSQAIRHLINVTVDQLHGAVTLVHGTRAQHLAVTATLARAALENTATGLWILGPAARDLRIERTLRWHMRNYQDANSTVALFRDQPALDFRERVFEVARRRPGIDAAAVSGGHKITTPLWEAREYSRTKFYPLWALASAFAHGRPWAYQGLLEREVLTVASGDHSIVSLRPREDLNLWLPLEAVHLLGELLRRRDRQAGMAMPPTPDGFPDSLT